METQRRPGPIELVHPDACPFPRPFPPGFAECGAYQPTQFVAFDTNHRPLSAVRTCQHLDLGTAAPGEFYARCRLGTAADRGRWVESQRAERAIRIQALGERSVDRTREALEAMWAAKAEQLREHADGAPPDGLDAQLREAADRFLDVQLAFLEDEATELDALGFPLTAVRPIVEAAVEDLVTRPSAESSWEPDPALIEAFPPRNRAYVAALFGRPKPSRGA